MTRPNRSETNSNRELQTSAEEEARLREFWENEDEIISTRGTIEDQIRMSQASEAQSSPLLIVLDTILWVSAGILLASIFFAPEIYYSLSQLAGAWK